MKNMKPLFLLLMSCLFLFFTACQKENVKTDDSKKAINETELVQARMNACDVGWTYARDTPSVTCGDPDLTVCYIDFTPIELEDNQTCGRVNVNSDGDLEFTFDQINLDQTVLEDMYTTRNFSVQRNIELPLDVISPLYVAAGFPPLEEPIVLQTGDYPVSFNGEVPEGPDYPSPHKLVIIVGADGVERHFWVWVPE